ncbi:MAG: glycosyltransferase family 4 protein [Acidimicrobiales bacterium]
MTSSLSVVVLGAEPLDVPGGLNSYIRELLPAWSAAGMPARPVFADPSAPFLKRLTCYRREALAAANGAALVDAHFPLYAVAALSARGLRRLPLVVHFHGPWADEAAAQGESAWRTGTKRAVERAYYRRVAHAVVLSQTFADLLEERYGVPASRITVIPPGIDVDHFCPGSQRDARRQVRLPEGAFVAVAVRRLVRRMGLDLLLEAWAKIAADVPHAVLVLVGDGPERPALQQRAADLGLADAVAFTGRVPFEALVTYYRAADVSVVPSIALEGFGLTVLESLACGVPALVTDVCGSATVASNLSPDCVVPPGDVDALAARLVEASRAPLADATACRRLAETFSWAKVADRHRRLYESLLARPRPLRVAYLDHCAELSCAEIALLRLLPGMPGVEPHVILAADGPLTDRLRTAGVRVEVLELAPSARNLRRARVSLRSLPIGAAIDALAHTLRLARRIRGLDVDLIHTNSLKAAVYGGLAGRLAGVPVVWHVHDRIADDYLPGFAVRLVRALARVLPSAVIANSDATMSTLGRFRKVSAVVPSPVAGLRKGRPSFAAPVNRPLRVGMVGRLAPWKGQDVFLEAVARAFPRGEVEVLVVGTALFGDEGYAVELRQLAAHLGVDPWVEFVGFQEDVGAILDVLDVLVHASLVPEPFGLVVAEGMAAGIAVLAADEGGPAEMIEHGRSGLLYPPGDVTALAGLLRRVERDSTLRASLGAEARLDARRFLPAAVQAEVVAVYDRVLPRANATTTK